MLGTLGKPDNMDTDTGAHMGDKMGAMDLEGSMVEVTTLPHICHLAGV
jgi:hypothetical protein